jgi:hypothetical protein
MSGEAGDMQSDVLPSIGGQHLPELPRQGRDSIPAEDDRTPTTNALSRISVT